MDQENAVQSEPDYLPLVDEPFSIWIFWGDTHLRKFYQGTGGLRLPILFPRYATTLKSTRDISLG
jgi:hypothetical protein